MAQCPNTETERPEKASWGCKFLFCDSAFTSGVQDLVFCAETLITSIKLNNFVDGLERERVVINYNISWA